MTPKELREIIERQERLLQFEHFNNSDALELGLAIIEIAKENGYAPAISIVINGFLVFRYSFDGTNINNDVWLRCKQNTAMATGHSSLHFVYKLAETGVCQEDLYMPRDSFAASGGCFPIYLMGTGAIGYACVSELPHETDHKMLVEGICRVLGLELEEPSPTGTGYLQIHCKISIFINSYK